MRALVIGASGFVGRHLVAHLRDIGDEVVAIDRASGGPDICDAYAITAHVHASSADTRVASTIGEARVQLIHAARSPPGR